MIAFHVMPAKVDAPKSDAFTNCAMDHNSHDFDTTTCRHHHNNNINNKHILITNFRHFQPAHRGFLPHATATWPQDTTFPHLLLSAFQLFPTDIFFPNRTSGDTHPSKAPWPSPPTVFTTCVDTNLPPLLTHPFTSRHKPSS